MSSETPAEKSATPSPSPARVIDAVEPSSQDLLETTPQAEGEPEEDNDTKLNDEGGDTEPAPPPPPPPPNAWQAIFSPQHGAYYFFNTNTKETTWVNPLQPEASTSSIPPTPSAEPSSSTSTAASESTPVASKQSLASTAHHLALQEAALAAGIDPALAYLDPSLVSKGPAGPNFYTAKFNARTGAFTAVDARDPGHLSEFERAKRMSEFYFDVGAWEKDVEERKRAEREAEENGTGKRKRPTKTDLVSHFTFTNCCLHFVDDLPMLTSFSVMKERFKEQKKAKKIAKTAWLRE
ncbi:hypothetical protein HWV62_16248 [Athelia sp. TMB]|nr:hypothetical protein HWV62_16248 [Athelia sp. TMB]